MNTGATRRRELIRAYKERPIQAGVFQIKNVENGKVLLGSSLNLEGVFNKTRFLLGLGSFRNPTLQWEWHARGADAFVFEVLETVTPRDDPYFDLVDELTLLEEIWLERLCPYGDAGYNVEGADIRQV